MTVKKRIGVLISGRGSNLVSLMTATKEPDYPAEIALVLSNVLGAAGLQRAIEAGITAKAIDHRDFARRQDFDAALTVALQSANVDIICNAGFMRLHSSEFVSFWQGKQLNIHPSLLPSFKGLHPQRQALRAGVRISGCTVHFVSDETDGGPILAQGAVPVFPEDDEEKLSARILEVEHKLYPLALQLVASEKAWLAEGRVIFSGEAPQSSIFYQT